MVAKMLFDLWIQNPDMYMVDACMQGLSFVKPAVFGLVHSIRSSPLLREIKWSPTSFSYPIVR